MTHDELLAEIDKQSYYDDSEVLGVSLRAVVELHTPMEASHIPKPWFACKHCSGYDAENIYVGYPCPTIQAIQEQLK